MLSTPRFQLEFEPWSVTMYLGIVVGNPGVFLLYPYPYPSKPLPSIRGRGFLWVGSRVFKGF